MADQDRADAVPDEASAADTLAAAEELAAREAAAETAADSPSGPGSSAKVARPRTKASGGGAAPKSGLAKAVANPGPKGEAVSGTLVTGSSPRAVPAADGPAGSVSLDSSGAAVVNARTVDVSRGGIGRVQAVDVAVTQGGVGLARAERVSVEMGGIGLAIGGDVRVTQGGVSTILARDVTIEQAGVRTIVANNVKVERTTGVLVMIARHVEGDVRTILDWRGAIAFGAAFGVVVSFFRRRRGR
jgi:hypothetical protein